jgi:leucyl aminopeptidase (aminopeptidase T)
MNTSMRTTLYWEEFAEVAVRRCVRPKPGDPLLILTSTANDISLAEACLAAGIRAGADVQLMVIPRRHQGTPWRVGPIFADAMRASKYVLALDVDFLGPVAHEARSKGTSFLHTSVNGVEDYVVRALLDVDVEAMNRNAQLAAKLWDQTKHCRLTSPQGTDVSFQLMPRKSRVGDGVLTGEGSVAFFPGTQVGIAPVEETINGTIVIDASDSVQGIVHTPYSFIMEKGVITAVEGGEEADIMRGWLESLNDERIYRLDHFSLGLNPQAGISGNMTEDERKLAAVDFGFGRHPCPYHEDIMLATPTIYLDGKEMSGGGKLNPEMGFEQLRKYLGGHHQ